MTALKTRIAPSPTGHLHLGHVLHIMCVQGIAMKLGADISLRLEDHDQSRCRPEFASSILEDLAWLGVKLPKKLWHQSQRNEVYQTNLEDLMRKGLVYACSCSRKNIQLDTEQSSGELRYPGTCREKNIPLNQPDTCIRLKIPNGDISFSDLFLGELKNNPADQSGDVVIRDRIGQWTYQYAVVIDDLDQEINLIIRGKDLLSSTARQLVMRDIISPGKSKPIFAHHPLIADNSGNKLSKRFLSEALSVLRNNGISADKIRGMAAHLAGLTETDCEITIASIPNLFPNSTLKLPNQK